MFQPKIDDVLTTAKAADDVIQNNVSSLLTTVRSEILIFMQCNEDNIFEY